MKTTSKIFSLLAIPVWLLFFVPIASAQTKAEKQAKKEVPVSNLLKNKRYTFTPETANPVGGGFIQLTGGFWFEVKKDSLSSYLPYYGVAYQAPLTNLRGPLDFNASGSDYTSQPAKKGRTIVTLKPRGVDVNTNDVREIYLDISAAGDATLSVLFNNRQSISFEGHISGKESGRL